MRWCCGGVGSLISGLGVRSQIRGEGERFIGFLKGDGSRALLGNPTLFMGDGERFRAPARLAGGVRWRTPPPVPAGLAGGVRARAPPALAGLGFSAPATRIALMTPGMVALSEGSGCTILQTALQYGLSLRVSLIFSGLTLVVNSRTRAHSSAMILPMAHTSERWSRWLVL